MTLADSQAVEGAVINTFLETICKGNAQVKYFSLSQIRHYSMTFRFQVPCNWNIDDVDYILAPLHIHGNQWAMGVFDMEGASAEVMDSGISTYTELSKY